MSLKASNKVDTNRYELEIVIDAPTFADAVAKAYRKNVKKINVPGFRKGHAPRSIIERLYGKDFFYEDALNALYPEALEGAVKEAGLEMIEDKIDFDLVSMDENGVDFKITITVKPEVSISGYAGLKAEKVKPVVTDEEIDAQVAQMAERNARMITVEDRAAADGDTVVIDFEGFVDGKAFAGGKAEGHSLKLGSNQFIPGFEEQIVGHHTGDEFDVNVSFPEDYHAEELKGKPAVFKVKLHEIKMTELPEIDDEFAKDVSEFDTLSDYKADLKAKALEYKQKSADDAVENQLIDQLIEKLEAEIPEAMFERRVDENVRDFGYRLQMQGMDLDTYVKYMGGDMAAFRDSFRAQAERQVKVRLALEKIAELEKLKPSDEEISAEYEKYAKSYNMEIDKIKAAIPQAEVEKDLAVTKAIDFVREHADITEVDAPSEKPAAKKSAAKKPAAKKPAAKAEDAAEKPAEAAEAEKPAAKKPAAKKPAAKKPAAKTADGAAEKKPASKKTAKSASEEK